MKINRNQKGFTLIEVVLVLAIGGLIFLLAFLAFQQVSTNRRDTQRRSDAARVLAETENYYGDKNVYPATSVALTAATTCTTSTADSFGLFMQNYVCKGSPKTFQGPKNTGYAVEVGATVGGTGTAAIAAAVAEDTVRYNATNCDGTAGRSVQIGLEKGVACRDNK